MNRAGRFDWSTFFARLEVGELPPEQVPDEMVAAMRSGCDSPTVAALASLSSPTTRDLEDVLPALASEVGCPRPSHRQALKLVGDAILRRIVDGAVDPYAGGLELRALWKRQPFRDEDRDLWEQFVEVYGIADEISDDPSHRNAYAKDIVRAARSRLTSGGFDIGSGPR
jgi:hypothetical protein